MSGRFSEVLPLLHRGELDEEIGEAILEAVVATITTGVKPTITIKLDVKPLPLFPGSVSIAASVQKKIPQIPSIPDILKADEEGNLFTPPEDEPGRQDVPVPGVTPVEGECINRLADELLSRQKPANRSVRRAVNKFVEQVKSMPGVDSVSITDGTTGETLVRVEK